MRTADDCILRAENAFELTVSQSVLRDGEWISVPLALTPASKGMTVKHTISRFRRLRSPTGARLSVGRCGGVAPTLSSDGVAHATPAALPPFAHCRSLRLRMPVRKVRSALDVELNRDASYSTVVRCRSFSAVLVSLRPGAGNPAALDRLRYYGRGYQTGEQNAEDRSCGAGCHRVWARRCVRCFCGTGQWRDYCRIRAPSRPSHASP